MDLHSTGQQKENQNQLTPVTLWLMTITTCLVVANIYYNQPLLTDMAKRYGVSRAEVGHVAMLTQMGYAAGMLFIVPLADMFKRKKLMVIDFALMIMALLVVATASNLVILSVASFFLGLFSVIPQMIIPMAAHLAEPHERGKKIGFVMSGLLIGILLSRTLSGFIGEHFGWQAIFYIAAVLMIILWGLIFKLLPEVEPTYTGQYSTLMKSLSHLFITQPKLRLAAFRGALVFAAFSAFWSTLIFLLEEPQFNKGSAVAGAFGLIGAFGALAAGLIGRLNDRIDSYRIIIFTLASVLISFIIFYYSGSSFIGLVIGVLLMDMGVQATHISNQTIILALIPEARNRINTIYMVSYFMGGAAGTFVATQLWSGYGWKGVCVIGMSLSFAALVIHVVNRKKISSRYATA